LGSARARRVVPVPLRTFGPRQNIVLRFLVVRGIRDPGKRESFLPASTMPATAEACPAPGAGDCALCDLELLRDAIQEECFGEGAETNTRDAYAPQKFASCA
jgi:hypothetical protein